MAWWHSCPNHELPPLAAAGPSIDQIRIVPSSDPEVYASEVGANLRVCTGPWCPLFTSSSCIVHEMIPKSIQPQSISHRFNTENCL